MPQAPVRLTDVITEPRYDTVTIVTGTALATFFAQPLGQGTGSFGAAGAAKTLADTNMDLAGQLPTGFAFNIAGFRLGFPWDIVLADFRTVVNRAVFRFFSGAKAFLTVPARSVPAGNGPFGFFTQAAAADATIVNNGWPSMQNGYGIRGKPLQLRAQENFKVELIWPATTPTVAQTGYQPSPGLPITIYLDGDLGRPVQ